MRLVDADSFDKKLGEYSDRHWDGEFYAAEDIRSMLEDMPTVNPYEWISVEDRLPEKIGKYLIFTTIYFTPDHIDEEDHFDGIEISGFFPNYGFVGANGLCAKFWMPLPAPPTEKEN